MYMYMQTTVPAEFQAEKYVFAWCVFTFQAPDLKAQNSLKFV